ncbi:MAG: hypothetical protein CRU78_08100 [Candidatus Accumulibacter phosphatis]|uniref:Uncharacterized protein n=1 Tax=Candidatus Accumulibacter phosphatis TaxID=327160 RepID=A0A6A7RTR4_9PROT|nr:hypothetical protein [Candidatus Accumulibacter phosphatis]
MRDLHIKCVLGVVSAGSGLQASGLHANSPIIELPSIGWPSFPAALDVAAPHVPIGDSGN